PALRWDDVNRLDVAMQFPSQRAWSWMNLTLRGKATLHLANPHFRSYVVSPGIVSVDNRELQPPIFDTNGEIQATRESGVWYLGLRDSRFPTFRSLPGVQNPTFVVGSRQGDVIAVAEGQRAIVLSPFRNNPSLLLISNDDEIIDGYVSREGALVWLLDKTGQLRTFRVPPWEPSTSSAPSPSNEARVSITKDIGETAATPAEVTRTLRWEENRGGFDEVQQIVASADRRLLFLRTRAGNVVPVDASSGAPLGPPLAIDGVAMDLTTSPYTDHIGEPATDAQSSEIYSTSFPRQLLTVTLEDGRSEIWKFGSHGSAVIRVNDSPRNVFHDAEAFAIDFSNGYESQAIGLFGEEPETQPILDSAELMIVCNVDDQGPIAPPFRGGDSPRKLLVINGSGNP
ncbi:MAG: hypothetical protein AAFP90_23115, partial [Planctomycetota bacterium]